MIAPTPEFVTELEVTVPPKETTPVAFELLTLKPFAELTAPLSATSPVDDLFTVKVPVLLVTIPPTVSAAEPEWLIVPAFGAVIAL